MAAGTKLKGPRTSSRHLCGRDCKFARYSRQLHSVASVDGQTRQSRTQQSCLLQARFSLHQTGCRQVSCLNRKPAIANHFPLHRIRNTETNQEYKVFYVGTNNGRIYKIVQFIRNGDSNSKLLDIFEVATNEAIQVMQISPKHKSLYVSTDHRIKQIHLEMCTHRYDSCFRCVKDPYCGWDVDTGACKPFSLGLLQVRTFEHNPIMCNVTATHTHIHSMLLSFVVIESWKLIFRLFHPCLQDVANETTDICDTSIAKNNIVVTYGQSIHLGCFETVPEILKDQQVVWYHHSKDNGR